MFNSERRSVRIARSVGRGWTVWVARSIGLMVGVAMIYRFGAFHRAARSLSHPFHLTSQEGLAVALAAIATAFASKLYISSRPPRGGLGQSQSRLAGLPRHEGFACPSCKTAPAVGKFWVCSRCKKPFDPFETQASCPYCGEQFAVTVCMNCYRRYPISDWVLAAREVPRQA